MRVHVYLRRPDNVKPFIRAAAAGFKRHGIDAKLLPATAPRRCDLAVCWSIRDTAAIASGKRALIMERGYVGDRFQWASMGYDGLNGRADFLNEHVDGERWAKNFAHLMQPWRGHDGKYVLILGQVRTDTSVRGINTFDWYRQTAKAIRDAGHDPWYREHPKQARRNMDAFRAVSDLPHRLSSLDEAMADARWTVTFNSNSAVESVLAGIPAVTCDEGAMAWPVTGHDPATPPPMPDRTRWAERLAWCQWNMAEIEAGEAWEHLKRGAPA
jgi:hypothetical protein